MIESALFWCCGICTRTRTATSNTGFLHKMSTSGTHRLFGCMQISNIEMVIASIEAWYKVTIDVIDNIFGREKPWTYHNPIIYSLSHVFLINNNEGIHTRTHIQALPLFHTGLIGQTHSLALERLPKSEHSWQLTENQNPLNPFDDCHKYQRQ